MTATELPAAVSPSIVLNDYAKVQGQAEVNELRALARPLRNRTVQMVNSTKVGGGVAELLNRIVPLAQELDLKMSWEIVAGTAPFYDVTKAFHNALHGTPYA